MLKVVLVEDETLIREGIKNAIPWEQYGYQFAGEASDGEMALPIIRKTRPDVLITDIKMPFLDGLSLSKIVREEFPQIKIIIVSGYDDFNYAKQAIEAGVDQYILKPITKHNLKEVLVELQKKIEQERDKKDYQRQYDSEMLEYGQYQRRVFFEKILAGNLPLQKIYEEANKLSIEITASSYNLLFFHLQDKNLDIAGEQTPDFVRKHEEVMHYFQRNPQYILFQWNINGHGVLIKSDDKQIDELTRKALDVVQKMYEGSDENIQWHVIVGDPIERLSLLPECYHKINQYYAYRFVLPNLHVFSVDTLDEYVKARENESIENVDSATMKSEVIQEFLLRGSIDEIHDFADTYLNNMKESLKSKILRNYVVLNIHFTILEFVKSLGVSQEVLDSIQNKKIEEMNMQPEEVYEYLTQILESVITLRDEKSDYQSGKVLRRAIEYIDSHYDQESLSLNEVAGEVKVSPAYLSGIFSQSMDKTFIEYVTAKRMEKAKRLLKTTDKRSNEVAAEVGYKDPHYFSFVFKKTQGCSPREYRGTKK